VPNRLLWRSVNVLRRLASGLPVRGGVSPVVPNDLFQAHLAIYLFAARSAAGRRVLDLGCGTGYGSARLAAAGAASVVGIDPDERSLAYARRCFAKPGVRFVRGAVEELPDGLGPFDLIVAVNLLAHLAAPAAVVEGAARRLDPAGELIASVPPVVDERTMEAHRASGLHRSNLYLWDWESLLRRRFREVRAFGAVPPAGLDLADPAPSRLAAADFRFAEVSPAQPATAGSLSAVFVCRGVRG
jgi:SAM-dependent methyltransferase